MVAPVPLGCAVWKVRVICGVLTLPAPADPPEAEANRETSLTELEETTAAIHLPPALNVVHQRVVQEVLVE